MRPGPNKNPAVSWTKGPAHTASYALITYDTDVPESFANAYKEGPILTASDKRRDTFYHWVLIDIPPDLTRIPEGAEPAGVPGPSKYGLRVVHQAGGGARAGYDGAEDSAWAHLILGGLKVIAARREHCLMPRVHSSGQDQTFSV